MNTINPEFSEIPELQIEPGAFIGFTFARLTSRHRNVLCLVRKGFRNAEIALHLGLSPRLVKACVSELLLIFDVSNRTELAGLSFDNSRLALSANMSV